MRLVQRLLEYSFFIQQTITTGHKFELFLQFNYCLKYKLLITWPKAQTVKIFLKFPQLYFGLENLNSTFAFPKRFARMAELVDALVSNTNEVTLVPVRLRLRVL